MCSRSAYVPAWNEPPPDTFSQIWNASDEPIDALRLERVAASLVPHPGWISTLTGSPVTARRVQLPVEPARREQERQDQDREDDRRPPTCGGAADDGADRRRAGVAGRRTARSSRCRHRVRVGGFDPARRRVAGAAAVEPDGSVRGSGSSGPPPSSGAGHPRGRASSHDCRITAAAEASMSSRWAAAPLAPPGVGVSEVALGDHRGEALVVGVDLDAAGAREPRQRRDLGEHGPGRGTELARRATGAARPRCASAPDLGRGGDDGAVVVVDRLAARVERAVAGWPARRTDREREADAARRRGRRRGPARRAGSPAGGEHRRVEERERVVDRADVLPAALHHVGVLGRAATERLRRVARDLGRRHARVDAVLADRDREPGLGAVGVDARRARRRPSRARRASRCASVRSSSGVSPSRRTTTTPSTAAAASSWPRRAAPARLLARASSSCELPSPAARSRSTRSGSSPG